jgi:hypothetical protein
MLFSFFIVYYKDLAQSFNQAENLAIKDQDRRQLCTNIIFGEAASFYEIKIGEVEQHFVVYTPLEQRSEPFNLYARGVWGASYQALPVSWIRDVGGIWKHSLKTRVHILRKHPGLSFLTPEELGQEENMESNENDDEHSDCDSDHD